MSGVVFLPIFIAMAEIEIALRLGRLPFQGLSNRSDGFLVLYLIMILPALIGSLIFTTATFLVPRIWTYSKKRIAAVLLAFIVPSAAFVAGIFVGLGGLFYGYLFLSTTSPSFSLVLLSKSDHF